MGVPPPNPTPPHRNSSGTRTSGYLPEGTWQQTLVYLQNDLGPEAVNGPGPETSRSSLPVWTDTPVKTVH